VTDCESVDRWCAELPAGATLLRWLRWLVLPGGAAPGSAGRRGASEAGNIAERVAFDERE